MKDGLDNEVYKELPQRPLFLKMISDLELDEETDRSDKEAPNVVTVVLDPEQKAVFDEALDRVRQEIGTAKDSKARAVTRMAEVYLESRVGATGTGS